MIVDMTPRKTKLEDRFWPKVDISKVIGCWEWQAGKNSQGYGMIRDEEGKNICAHRASWILLKGKIPKGMQVLHECNNPGCVNPNHLYLGTHATNMAFAAMSGSFGKLSIKEVVEIRRLWSLGFLRQKEIATIFNVKANTISRVVNYKVFATYDLECGFPTEDKPTFKE